MKKLIWLFFASSLVVHAQGIMHGNGTPASLNPQPNCGFSRFYVDDSTQIMYISATGSPCVWAAAGSGYTLPIATPAVLGGVKPDNSTCTVDGTGVLSCVGGGYLFSTTQTVVGSTTQTITFAAIPQTANDLELMCSGKVDDTVGGVGVLAANLAVNADTTAAHYKYSQIYNTSGSAAGGTSGSLAKAQVGWWGSADAGATTASFKVLFSQYANTTFKNKNFQSWDDWYRLDLTIAATDFFVGHWIGSGSGPFGGITQIDITEAGAGHFTAGTKCTLRGLP